MYLDEGRDGPLAPDWALGARRSSASAPEAAEVYGGLAALLGHPPIACQVIHGDLVGNVHVDRSSTPVVLDFSPYLRPREGPQPS